VNSNEKALIKGSHFSSGSAQLLQIQNNGQIPSPIGHGSSSNIYPIIALESTEVGLKAMFTVAATVVRPEQSHSAHGNG
jgi:hypothetical protein